MKENRIKLLAVCALAAVFMITFTCCVRTDITSGGDGNNSRVTLFAPPEENTDATTTSPDGDITTDTIITMPPISSENETTTHPEITDTVAPETTRSEDTVYSGFSGLY